MSKLSASWALGSAALSLLLGGAAHADLFTVVGKDGQITITSRPARGAKILHRVKDEGPAPVSRAGGRARRAGGEVSVSEAGRAGRYAAAVKAASKHYSLPEALIFAVMKTESNFYPEVVSNKGAQGLMQLMPGTATEMGVSDAFDPTQNINGGARYLRILANKFEGDLVLTLSAYHAGGGAVDSVGGIPYSQTAEYVRRVLNHYYAYQNRLPTGEAPGEAVAGSDP
ncbi:MAG: lytic transglycosylase domain-containing protein [Myxococcales bacterium]|nr:lytic transglycosylase domain-containing protein [Myxococcales bacterium]